jgi:hypothetical protein
LEPEGEAVNIPHDHDPRAVSDHFPIVMHLRFAPSPGGGGTTQLRIERLLPNPAGDGAQEETVTLKNPGTASVSLAGSTLRDLERQTWTLDAHGSSGAGESKIITRNG